MPIKHTFPFLSGIYISIPENQYNELITLNRKLLAAANMLMERKAMIQPFFSIVKDHAKVINELDLMPKEKISKAKCTCQGFYQSVDCPVHDKR